MSDDPPQPPRPRPKLRLAPEPAAPAPVSPPPPTAAPLPPLPESPAANDPAADVLRLRLKPKVPAVPAPSPDNLSTPPPAVSPAPATPPPAMPEPAPRLKLAPTDPAGADPLMPPPPKITPPPPSPAAAPLPPPAKNVPFVRAAPDVPESAYTPAVPNTAPVYRADGWLAAVVALCVVGVVGFYGVRYFLNRPQPPPAAPASPASSANAIERAREAAVAHDANVSAIDDVSRSAENHPAPATEPAVTETPPAVAEPPLPEVLRIEPTQEFRDFVASLKVNGVFQGEPARALLNGKMYGVGQLVEPALGITFVGVETDTKDLVFEDIRGAIVKRHY